MNIKDLLLFFVLVQFHSFKITFPITDLPFLRAMLFSLKFDMVKSIIYNEALQVILYMYVLL